MNAVARLGKAFRPVEGNAGTDPSSVLVLRDGDTSYVAMFNFGSGTATASVALARAGLDGGASHDATDLWSGAVSTAQGMLSAAIEAGSARLFALRARP